MSISGLSNHLCIVVAVVINVLVASSTFQRVCAATDFHAFYNSRQFKKNLAVSKHRNNTFWLPNYTWTPPEQFKEPRKRPAWEVKKVVETTAEKKKREEREKWEKKMREVTRREREKWKNDKTNNEISMPVEKVLERKPENVESKDSFGMTKNQPDVLIELNKNLHNSRWGMSVVKPVANQFFNNSRKAFDSIITNRMRPEIVEKTTFPNGRWGMSVKKPPKEFLKEMSWISPSKVRSEDEDRMPLGNRKIHGDREEREEKKNTARRRPSPKLTRDFPNGRWSMTKDSPSREFLREISRHGHERILRLYKPRTFHQTGVDTTAENNNPSRPLKFSKIPGISNIEISEPLPAGVIIRGPMFLGYVVNSRK